MAVSWEVNTLSDLVWSRVFWEAIVPLQGSNQNARKVGGTVLLEKIVASLRDQLRPVDYPVAFYVKDIPRILLIVINPRVLVI